MVEEKDILRWEYQGIDYRVPQSHGLLHSLLAESKLQQLLARLEADTSKSQSHTFGSRVPLPGDYLSMRMPITSWKTCHQREIRSNVRRCQLGNALCHHSISHVLSTKSSLRFWTGDVQRLSLLLDPIPHYHKHGIRDVLHSRKTSRQCPPLQNGDDKRMLYSLAILPHVRLYSRDG